METIIFLSATMMLAAFTAAFSSLVFYCIGSPSGFTGDPSRSQLSAGRIFSLYGRFVLDGFARHEEKENARLAALLKVKTDTFERERLESQAKFSVYNNKNIDQDLEKESKAKSLNAKREIERERRPNIYSFAGACYTCFCVWVSIASGILFIGLSIYPCSLVGFLFFPFFVSLCVTLSKFINN